MKKVVACGMGDKNYMSEILKKYGKEKEEKRVPFSEKGISDCTDCCRCCSEFECPANETRCQ